MVKRNLFFVAFLWTSSLNCQLIVDAGKDTSYCSGLKDSIILGGNPTAKNGIEPYKYIWKTVAQDKENNIFKDYSDFINNDTIANPIFKSSSCKDLIVKLYVKVIDKNNNEVNDSVIVLVSAIGCVHARLYSPEIKKGDTCKLGPGNIFNGFPPFKYKWSPEYNISDPFIRNPLAWPYKTTKYLVNVLDSLGCKSSDDNNVIVDTTIVFISNTFNYNIKIYPNPITNNSILKIQKVVKNTNITIYTIDGNEIYRSNINSNIFEIGKIMNDKGLYILSIEEDKKIVFSSILIK